MNVIAHFQTKKTHLYMSNKKKENKKENTETKTQVLLSTVKIQCKGARTFMEYDLGSQRKYPYVIISSKRESQGDQERR